MIRALSSRHSCRECSMTLATPRCIMPAARPLCRYLCTGTPMVCPLELNLLLGEAQRAHCCTLPTNLKPRVRGAVVARQLLLNDVVRLYGRPSVAAPHRNTGILKRGSTEGAPLTET